MTDQDTKQILEAIAAQSEKIATINDTIAVQSEKIATINDTIAVQSEKIATINDTIAAQSEKITKIDKTIAAQGEKIAAHDKSIATLSAAITASSARVAEEFTDFKREVRTRFEDVEKRLDALEDGMQGANRSLDLLIENDVKGHGNITLTRPEYDAMVKVVDLPNRFAESSV